MPAHPPDEIAGLLVYGSALEHRSQVRVWPRVDRYVPVVEQRDSLPLARHADSGDLRRGYA